MPKRITAVKKTSESSEIKRKIKQAEKKAKDAVLAKELEKYLESGQPALLAKLKEKIIFETVTENAEGPTLQKQELLKNRFEKAGLEKKIKQAEDNLTKLMQRGDPVTKTKVIRAAGKLGLKSVVERGAMDADPYVRFEAGVTAARCGMPEITRKIAGRQGEKYETRFVLENELRHSEGKQKLQDIYPKWVVYGDKKTREIHDQIKKEK